MKSQTRNRLLGATLALVLAFCGASLGLFGEYAQGITTRFYADNSSDDGLCDVFNWSGSRQACNPSTSADNPPRRVRLRTGQTFDVPIMYNHVKAYFSADVDGSGAPVIPPGMRYTVTFLGADLCLTDNGAQINSKDNVYDDGSNFFKPSTLPRGSEVTYFGVGKTVTYDTIAGLEGDQPIMRGSTATNPRNQTNGVYRPTCPADDGTRTLEVTSDMLSEAVGLRDSAGRQVFFVNVITRHINNHPGLCEGDGGRNGGCDGITNGFSIIQDAVGDGTREYGIASAGQRTARGLDANAYGATATGGNNGLRGGPNNSDVDNDYSLVLRFGSDCQVPAAGEIVTVMLYDIDGGPNISGNREKRFALNRTRLDPITKVPTGTWRLEPHAGQSRTAYRASNPRNSLEGRWVNGHVSGNRYANAGADGVITSNDAGYTYVTFRAYPNERYEFYLMNINPGVVNQWSLPYDAIYYRNPCGGIVNLTPSVGFSTSRAEAGTPIDATASIQNSNTPVTANYTRQLWYSNTNDPNAAPAQGIRTQTATVTAVSGRTNLPTAPDWTVTPDSTYNYLCTRLTINAPGDVKTAATCVQIGKYPSLSVRNGDARTGGAVPRGACNITGGNGSIIGHRYGLTDRGSFADFGVLSRLDITDFGSTSISPSSPGVRQLYFGSGSAYLPTLGAGSDGYFYRSRLGSESVAGHCLPNVASVYPAGAITTTIPASQTRSIGSYASTQTFTFAQNAAGQTSVITLPGAVLAPNQRVSVRVNGPADCAAGNYVVRLTGNITRSTSTVDTVPWYSLITTGSCVRVVVDDSVTSLYGLYATEGDIATCMGDSRLGFDDTTANKYPGDPSVNLNSTVCNQQLTFNGLVVTGRNALTYRTFGEGRTSGPAETFMLDPAFTISDYQRARLAPTFQTENQLELPPRY